MNDWEKFLNRRSANIGFRSRTGAFRDPSRAELSAALAIETKKWQDSIGEKPFKISEPYFISKGLILNIDEEHLEANKLRAVSAFVDTPMELVGKFKDWPIDLNIYTKPKGKIRKFFDWISRKTKSEDIKKRLRWIDIIRLTNENEADALDKIYNKGKDIK